MSINDQQILFDTVSKSRIFSHILKVFDLKNKSVLDVGCSEGHHLQFFGPGSVGITIIPEHVEKGKERGLDIVLKNVEAPDFSMDEKFDVVWANNLFEHLHAPHLFLSKMRDIVKEDGTLILGVPVIPHLSFLTKFKKFRGAYAVSHVNFFTRRTLIETVRFAGWEVQEARLFYMKNKFLDFFFNLIAPHIYIVAKPKSNFTYPQKRQRSLDGY